MSSGTELLVYRRIDTIGPNRCVLSAASAAERFQQQECSDRNSDYKPESYPRTGYNQVLHQSSHDLEMADKRLARTLVGV